MLKSLSLGDNDPRGRMGEFREEVLARVREELIKNPG